MHQPPHFAHYVPGLGTGSKKESGSVSWGFVTMKRNPKVVTLRSGSPFVICRHQTPTASQLPNSFSLSSSAPFLEDAVWSCNLSYNLVKASMGAIITSYVFSLLWTMLDSCSALPRSIRHR